MLVLFGVSMFYFRMPFNLFGTDVVVLSSDWTPLVTALWVVLMTNAINLIDGLDGLAAGIVAIAGARAVPLRRPAVRRRAARGREHRAAHRDHRGRGLPRASCRSTGTRRRSSWATPARCSSGSLLAVPTITIGGRTDFAFSGSTYFFFAPLLIPIVILGVPIVDTVFSFVRRIAVAPEVVAWPTRVTCTTG